jgi:hypothetical protein
MGTVTSRLVGAFAGTRVAIGVAFAPAIFARALSRDCSG